jgi:integration host factor subunit alpha
VNKSNLTKIKIAKNLSEKTGFSVQFSKKLIDDLINILIQNINENNCNLMNIGSFKLINKKERLGRNPKTKEEFTISSRKSLSFLVSKKLTNLLNQK